MRRSYGFWGMFCLGAGIALLFTKHFAVQLDFDLPSLLLGIGAIALGVSLMYKSERIRLIVVMLAGVAIGSAVGFVVGQWFGDDTKNLHYFRGCVIIEQNGAGESIEEKRSVDKDNSIPAIPADTLKKSPQKSPTKPVY